MVMQKVEFEFPADDDNSDGSEHINDRGGIDIEPSSATEMDAPVKEKKADSETETEIEIIDDTPEADKGKNTTSDKDRDIDDDDLSDYGKKVRARIAKEAAKRHDERRDKERVIREKTELENYTRQIMEENKRLKGTANKSQTAMYEQAKRTVTADLEQAETDYKAAYEAGDGEKLLAAQNKLTTARIRADKLAQIKIPPLQQAKDEVQETIPTAPQPAANVPKVDDRAVQWADDNDWWGKDNSMTAFALGYHQDLVDSGVDPQSDEYYEKIDSRMRKVFPDKFDDTDTDNQDSEEKAPANVVAGVSRTTRPRKITLTKTQVSIANQLGVPLEDYAREMAAEMGKNANG